MRLVRYSGVLLFLMTITLMPQRILGQEGSPCSTKTNFPTWINCRVEEIATAQVNQSEPLKQVEAPSIAESTTSLVDQTAAPDLVGMSLNLAGLNSKTEQTDTTSFSFTTSAYALYASFAKRDPLDPAFYLQHPALRNFSFTFGRELPDENDPSSNNRATIIGFKILAINKRDASIDANRTRLVPIAKSLLPEESIAFANTASEVREYLYEQLAPIMGLPAQATTDSKKTFADMIHKNFQPSTLSEEQVATIDEIITRRIGPRVTLVKASRKVIEEIRRAPQLSFTFQSKLRPEDGINEYRGGVIFDYGLYRRLNLTLNATYDYEDSKIIGGDKRGGRAAAELHYQLNPQRSLFGGKDPILLSFASENKWMTNTKPTFTGQLKLAIPIFDGITLPLSVSFANRSDLINESTVRGRVGFTFDFSKLVKGFR